MNIDSVNCHVTKILFAFTNVVEAAQTQHLTVQLADEMFVLCVPTAHSFCGRTCFLDGTIAFVHQSQHRIHCIKCKSVLFSQRELGQKCMQPGGQNDI
jgi:hypothetical protein